MDWQLWVLVLTGLEISLIFSNLCLSISPDRADQEISPCGRFFVKKLRIHSIALLVPVLTFVVVGFMVWYEKTQAKVMIYSLLGLAVLFWLYAANDFIVFRKLLGRKRWEAMIKEIERGKEAEG